MRINSIGNNYSIIQSTNHPVGMVALLNVLVKTGTMLVVILKPNVFYWVEESNTNSNTNTDYDDCKS